MKVRVALATLQAAWRRLAPEARERALEALEADTTLSLRARLEAGHAPGGAVSIRPGTLNVLLGEGDGEAQAALLQAIGRPIDTGSAPEPGQAFGTYSRLKKPRAAPKPEPEGADAPETEPEPAPRVTAAAEDLEVPEIDADRIRTTKSAPWVNPTKVTPDE